MSETWTCEPCGAAIPLDDAIYSEGCYFCPSCWAIWQAEFAACEHDWVEHYNEQGEKGRCCKQCSGFVADEDFTHVFPQLAGTQAPKSQEEIASPSTPTSSLREPGP